jgi:calcium binding protein
MSKKRPRRDHDREERITMEIIVDAYNESEVWTGWYCYLENTLAFPFEAECVKSRKMSPLKRRERVTVLGMLDDDEGDGLGEMMVEAKWRDCTMGIPLAQIKGIGVDEKTVEAIADWHYWVAQGRQILTAALWKWGIPRPGCRALGWDLRDRWRIGSASRPFRSELTTD